MSHPYDRLLAPLSALLLLGGACAPAAPDPVAPASTRRVLATFSGEVDPASGITLHAVRPGARPGELQLPESSNGTADTVWVTTDGTPATDTSTCGAGQLSFSGNVYVRSFYASKVLSNVYLVIDTLSATGAVTPCNGVASGGGLTNAGGGLWSYGRLGIVGSGTDYAEQPWAFALASTDRFTFTGHVEADVADPPDAQFFLADSSAGPQGVAVDGNGNPWFAEHGYGSAVRAAIGTRSGGAFAEYGTPTSGSRPAGTCIGPDGNVWFTEEATGMIGRKVPGGAITEFALPDPTSQPGSIVAGPDGALWFVEHAGNRIGRITTGGALTEYAIPTASSGALSIAVGPDGAIWFTEYAKSKLGRVDPATGLVTEVAVGHQPWGLTSAYGVLLYTSPGGYALVLVDPSSGATTQEIALPGGPNGIATGPAGDVWTVCPEESLAIHFSYYSDTGESLASFPIPVLGISLWPKYVAVGPDGAVWYTMDQEAGLGVIHP